MGGKDGATPAGASFGSPGKPPRSPSKLTKPDRLPLLSACNDENVAQPSSAGAQEDSAFGAAYNPHFRSTLAPAEYLNHSDGEGRDLLSACFAGGSKLTSYTSEPPKTLLLMRQWAEQETARLEQEAQDAAQKAQQGVDNVPGTEGPTSATQVAATGTSQPGSPNNQQQPQATSPGSQEAKITEASVPLLRTFSALRTEARLTPRAKQAQPHPVQSAQRQGQGVRRRLGVQLLSDPLAEQRGVSNHRLAGDLFLGGSRGGSGGVSGFRIPPLPADMAAAVLQLDSAQRKTRSPAKAIKRMSSHSNRRDEKEEDEEQDQMDLEFNEDVNSKPIYKRAAFWKIFISITVTVTCMLAGVLMAVYDSSERLSSLFPWWRLLVFLSTLIPIYWVGTFVGRAIIWVTERRFFTAENALYFVYTVRKPLANVLRSALLMGSWAACMYDSTFKNRNSSNAVNSDGTPISSADLGKFYDAYIVILKLFGCLLLFFIAELMKVLFAKMIASKFNRESHVRKMQAALRKERHLHALLQPRPRPWQEEAEDLEYESEGEEMEGKEGVTSSGGNGPMQLNGPPNLVRQSAPDTASQGYRSWWSLGRSRQKIEKKPSASGLAPIEEVEEEGMSTPEKNVVVQIDTAPSSPNRTRPGSEASSPSRSTSYTQQHPRTGLVELSSQSGRSPTSQHTMPLQRAPAAVNSRGKPPLPPKQPATSKLGEGVSGQGSRQNLRRQGSHSSNELLGMQSYQPAGGPAKQGSQNVGGLVKQGSQNVGGLVKQGSQNVGGLVKQGSWNIGGLLKQGSQNVGNLVKQGSQNVGGILRNSVHGSGNEELKQASTGTGGQNGPIKQMNGKAPSTLDTESTRSLMRKGPVAIAAKMARVEKHIRKKALQVTFYDELGQTERREKVTNENEAKRLAFYLFYNVKSDFDRPYITVDDLEVFLPEKEAQEAFAMLDEDCSGKVSLAKCATAVMGIFKEREYLANSLRDTKSIVRRLAFMIGVGLHILMFFIYLLILGLNAWQVFVAIVPVLSAVSFALGSSVKQAVDSSIFLFVTHPFDVGDIIIFNDSWHMVLEITLPCTVLLRTADSAKIWYPNAQLMILPIQNVTVSPNLAEISSFIVDPCTPLRVVDEMRDAVAKYCNERTQDFNGKVSTWFDLAQDDSYPNRLALKVKVEYNYGLLNPRCYPARGALFHFILSKMSDLQVEVTNVMQPVKVLGLEGRAGGLTGGGWTSRGTYV